MKPRPTSCGMIHQREIDIARFACRRTVNTRRNWSQGQWQRCEQKLALHALLGGHGSLTRRICLDGLACMTCRNERLEPDIWNQMDTSCACFRNEKKQDNFKSPGVSAACRRHRFFKQKGSEVLGWEVHTAPAGQELDLKNYRKGARMNSVSIWNQAV